MIDRATCTTAFYEAVAACDPARRVRETLDREPVRGREVIGLAVGKAALAMARGAGAVARGLVVTTVDDKLGLPPGWVLQLASHPLVDMTSIDAGIEAILVVESARPDDVVLALISGGASALVEQPIAGVSFDEYLNRIGAAMASGTPISELNALRTRLSAIKGGKLAARSKAPVVTFVVSDVIGDDPRVIGSGPTVRDGDRVEVIMPMSCFGIAVADALAAQGLSARRLVDPIAGDVAAVADRIAAEHGLVVAWGEPTVRLSPSPGRGGRAQQLALELARRLRGSARAAFVAGSDGIDGPAASGPAGAFVDGTTWDAIVAARRDPEDALARCDAGTALDAVGALVVTGPTGINHADVVVVG